jgi:hypothetical protein
MLRSRSSLVLEMAALVSGALAVTGCASPDTVPVTASDSSSNDSGGSSGSGQGSGSSSGSGGSSGTDTADASADSCASLTCDASPTDPMPGRDGATPAPCVQCLHSKCAAELAGCATDCTCGPAYACLLNNKLNYSICMDGITALSNGNCALTILDRCSVMQCGDQCHPDGGL